MADDYAPLDLAEMADEAERVNRDPNAGAGFLDNFVKVPKKDGYLMMRFLPRRPGTGLFCATRTHKLAGRTYHCPRVLKKTENGLFWVAPPEGKDCPVCQYYRAEWQKSMRIEDKKQRDVRQSYLRDIKPVERYYYNVIVRECVNPKTNKLEENVGPLIYSCGKSVHQKIMTAIIGNVKAGKKAKGDITDPKTGRDFRLVVTITKGSGDFVYPDYGESEFEEVSPAGTPEQLKKWLENLHDLTKLRNVKEWEVLDRALKVHNGVIEADESDFDTSIYERHDAIGDVDIEEGEPRQASRSAPKPAAQPPKPIVKQERKEPAKPKDDEEIEADPDFEAELNFLEEGK